MLKKILYTISIVIFLALIIFAINNTNIKNILNSMENKAFDIEQSMIVNSGYKKPNQDIVIISIDDASYEYILDKYGEWPLPREVYAQIIDYLEAQNPQSIAFDLMFVKSLKSNANADKLLSDKFSKYKNIYTAMNFDNQSVELRIPTKLPDRLSVNVINNSVNINFDSLSFQNCRTILPQIIQTTSNIGMINVSRADDGIIRKMPVFVKYQDKYYPQLAFKVGTDIIKQKENFQIDSYTINKNSKLSFGNKQIYIDQDGSAILNWYGPTGAYKQIPIYKLIKSIDEGKKSEFNFNNKIIYFGTTAASLFDIKTTPISKIYPGVEVQATYVNNLLDNNFITKANKFLTYTIGIILALITGILVINISSTIIISSSVIGIYIIYLTTAYMFMKYANIWIDTVFPILAGFTAFVLAFVIKYIIKSRDFEQQYILATTDGLTDLYNHRYFQEQMRMQVEQSKRYGQPFSLIIIDIDFFKNFNDTFGHQAGDAVLRQVAQILKHNVRATDIVCRYGGEEMSIILPNTPKDISMATANKICKRIATKKFKLNNTQEGNVTISLGVASYPEDGQTATEIIDVADKHLYISKNNGRNQVN